MKFGTFHLYACPPWTNPYDVVSHESDQITLADQLGFDQVWLGEHNARRYGIVGNCLISAAAAAAATTNIRIGTAVTRLPLHNPLHLAEDLAHIDIISGGRFDWGLGKGYDPLEFSTYGVPFEDREERWQETYEAVLHYWTTGRTEFKGNYSEGADAELFPLPLQRPILPIYVMVSRSDSSVEWAARHLYPMHIGQGPDWDDVKHKLELYGETAAASGYSDTEINSALENCWQLKQMHVATTTQRAIDEYRDSLMWYYEVKNNRLMFGFSPDIQPYEYYVTHKSVLLGSSAQMVDEIGRYLEYTGMPNINCWFNCGHQPHAQVLGALERFSQEVIPELRGCSRQDPAIADKSVAKPVAGTR